MRLNAANAPLALVIFAAALSASSPPAALAEPSDYHAPSRRDPGDADAPVEAIQLRRLGKTSGSNIMKHDGEHNSGTGGSGTGKSGTGRSGTGGSGTGGSGTGSSSETTAQCAMYSIAYKSVSMRESTSFRILLTNDFLTAPNVRKNCGMCQPQCGPLHSMLCPSTCDDEDDKEEFCSDVADYSGSCFLQCLEFVSRCCPCGAAKDMFKFNASNAIVDDSTGGGVLTRTSNLLARSSSGAYLDAAFPIINTGSLNALIPPAGNILQNADQTDAEGQYVGPDLFGVLSNGGAQGVHLGAVPKGVGLIFGDVDFDQDTSGSAAVAFSSKDFQNGFGTCGTKMTSISFDVVQVSEIMKFRCTFRIIFKDSKRWHISKTVFQPGKRSAMDVTLMAWYEYEPSVNYGLHAGTIITTIQSTPSFNCVQWIGIWTSGEMTDKILDGSDFPSCVVKELQVKGLGPTYTC